MTPTICNKQQRAPFALRLIINFTVMFRRSAFYQFTIKHERFSSINSHSPVNDVDRSREIPFSKIQTHFWLTIWRISFNTGFYPLIIVLKFNLFSLFFPHLDKHYRMKYFHIIVKFNRIFSGLSDKRWMLIISKLWNFSLGIYGITFV